MVTRPQYKACGQTPEELLKQHQHIAPRSATALHSVVHLCHHVVLHPRRGCGGECQQRHAREALLEERQLGVVFAEVCVCK